MAGQTYQSLFNYGEVGNALDAFRDSEITKQSANRIVNFHITDMGTLQVARKFNKVKIQGLEEGGDGKTKETVMAVKVTRHNFIVLITQRNIKTMDKTTKEIIATLPIDGGKDVFDEYSNSNTFQDFVYVRTKYNKSKIFLYTPQGAIGELDYFKQVKLPYKFSKTVGATLWQVYEKLEDGQKVLIPEPMMVYNGDLNLRLVTTQGGDGRVSGEIFLSGVDYKIDRIYTTYKQSIDKSMIQNIRSGLRFLVLKTYNPTNYSENLGYHIDGNLVLWGDKHYDNLFGGDYYTNLVSNDGAGILEGNFKYGMKENFVANENNIIDFSEFQSRLVIATKEKLYFSKVLDMKDFSTGLGPDDGFFIKPSNIEGNQSSIKKLVAGNGIYIISSEGIYVCSYGQTITPTNQSVRIASTNKPLTMVMLIDDILYYLDHVGILRALVPSFDNGFVQFSNVIVDKYALDRFSYSFLTKVSANNRNCLLTTLRKDKSEFQLFEYVGENIFRRVSIELENNYVIHGVDQDLIIGDSYYVSTMYNMDHAKIVLNLPFLQTYNGGVYMNDLKQEYNRIVVQTFNYHDIYIRGVRMYGFNVNKSLAVGDYNVWDFMGTIPILNCPIDFYMSHNPDEDDIEGDKIVEIRGINCFLK